MSTKNSIQVAIKVRPLLRKEKDLTSCWRIVDNSIQLTESQSEPYCFDYIFDQNARNHIIFEKMARHIIHSGIQGFNGTIFAYGQTSSGKTYTMMGDDENPGVMVLAAKEIFKEIERASDRQFLLRIGYIEIYNEKIYDLLDKKNQDLKIHETATGIVSVNCDERIITCEEDLLHYLCMGNKERTVGETNMNERSSRSHAIFRIIIESRKMDRSDDDDAVIQSVLNLVDLAGSERADQTGARGTRLKEGGHINKSLLFLSNVIKRLSENEDDKYISYRDSKLTRILQASLGGNALTSIICTIKPTAVEETQSTLSFAMRAKSIKNKPQVNEIVSDATMMKRLEREIKDLKMRLEEERNRNESQIKVGQLEQRLKHEVLKLISCNSLHNIRSQREKRRRTWGPTTSNFDTAMQPTTQSKLITLKENAVTNKEHVHIFKATAHFGSQITLRNYAKGVKQSSAVFANKQVIEEDQEKFEPGEACIFEISSPSKSVPALDECKTPNVDHMRKLSLTPKLGRNAKSLERALHELEEFTNLEKKIDVKHDAYQALKQQLEQLSTRNSFLEQERRDYIEMKNEFDLTKQNLLHFEKRCDNLQIQISKLTCLNQDAKVAGIKYQEELTELKSTIEKLEVENRDAVSKDFEFKRLKNKSSLRETELLEVLAEKDDEISCLEKLLHTLKEDKLYNSKSKLESLSSDIAIYDAESVCVKCEELQRVLEENSKTVLDSKKLMQEYTQLQLNYREAKIELANAHSSLEEVEKSRVVKEAESKKFGNENAATLKKLEHMQQQYLQLSNKNITLHDEMRLLQEKQVKLEGDITDVQKAYDAIQLKYQVLQLEYEQLEHSSAQSLEDCVRLQSDNDQLQNEIVNVKMRLEDAHQKLQEENMLLYSKQDSHENACNCNQENEKLQKEFTDLQSQFEKMQHEYDILSNQLVDSIQDGEILRNECNKLEVKVNEFDKRELKSLAEVKQLQDEISVLKSQLEVVLIQGNCCTSKPSLSHWQSISTDSMKSSGIYLGDSDISGSESAETGAQLLLKFAQLVDTLQEIQLENKCGKIQTFTNKLKNRIADNLPAFRLVLKNIEAVSAHENIENCLYSNFQSRNIFMQGTLKSLTFYLMQMKESVDYERNGEELSVKLNHNESNENLKRLVDELNLQNNSLRNENKTILESTEKSINEMREQITKLSAELFEKSLFVEKCACEDYQKQIEALENKLKEQSKEFNENNECHVNITENDIVVKTSYRTELQPNPKLIKLLRTEFKQFENIFSFTKNEFVEAMSKQESKIIDLLTKLEKLKVQLIQNKKEYKDECASLQLELYEKLELNESDFRERIREYNRDWEEKERDYRETINQLKRDNETLEKSFNLKICKHCKNNSAKVDNDANQNILGSCNKESSKMDKTNVCDSNLLPEVDILEKDKLLILDLKVKAEKDLLQLKAENENSTRICEQQAILLLEQQTQLNLKYEQLLDVKNEQDKKINEMVREKHDVDVKLFNIIEEKSSHLQQLKILKEKLIQSDVLMQETVELKEIVALLNTNIERVVQEKEELKKQLVEVTDEMQSAIQKSKSLGEKSICEENLIESLQRKLKDLDNLSDDKQSLQIQCENFRSQMLRCEENLFNITNENQKLEQRLLENNDQTFSYEELVKSLKYQLDSLKTLAQEKADLESTMSELRSQHSRAVKSMQKEIDNMKLVIDEKEIKITLMMEKEETLCLKLDTLSQKLEKAKLMAENCESLQTKHENVMKELVTSEKENAEFADRLNAANCSLKKMHDIEKINAVTMIEQQSQIEQLKRELKANQADHQLQYKKWQCINEELTKNCSSLQYQCKDLQSSLFEIRLKYTSLEDNNNQLLQTIDSLKEQLKTAALKFSDFELMQKQLKELEGQQHQFQLRLKMTVEESERCCNALSEDNSHQKQQLKQQTQTNNDLRSLLFKKEKTFKEDTTKLEGTVSCLLQEKKGLEEKLHSTQITLKNYERELSSLQKKLDSGNISLGFNTSCSPLGRNCGDRSSCENSQIKSVNINVEGKLSKLQHKTSHTESLERKNRRLSTHDEHRRQLFWEATRDVASMTDPSDSNCNCVELDAKLKECERNLFIRQSQVTALNMELKNHPLKTENAALIKRIQEDQEKHRFEIKRYKEIIIEQKTKAANAEHDARLRVAEQTKPVPKMTVNVEIQTDSELDAALQKLQAKYNDLRNICRHRHTIIRELEEKLAQNKKVPLNEVDQVKLLGNECEAITRELKVYKQKYEDAKVLLQVRRDEIQKLRQQCGQT